MLPIDRCHVDLWSASAEIKRVLISWFWSRKRQEASNIFEPDSLGVFLFKLEKEKLMTIDVCILVLSYDRDQFEFIFRRS